MKNLKQQDPRVEASVRTRPRDAFGMVPLYASIEADAAEPCETCGKPMQNDGFAYPVGGGWAFVCGTCGRKLMMAGLAARVTETGEER